MADVFISYARTSFDRARSVAEGLKAHGCSVWLDEDLPANRAYADVISEQLDAAKATLVLWSRDGASSQWVRAEANRARERGALVQARLDDARLPLPFDQIQCLDLRDWHGDTTDASWRRLILAVDALVAAPGGAPLQVPARERRAPIGRRALLAGGAAATAATAAAGWLALSRRTEPEAEASPEIQLLIQKSLAVMQDGRPDEMAQPIAYLLEATRLAPRYAEAWGLLAFCHSLRKFQLPRAARPGEEARARSAARTALKLDSDQHFALSALALLVPPYRNWARAEAQSRDLVRRAGFLPLPHNLLADLFADVGRWRDAVSAHAKVDRRRFLIPLSDRSGIQCLWSSGDLQAAETMLDEAVRRWPRHEAIWNLRIRFLTHTGRANEAVRLLDDASIQPIGQLEIVRQSALLTARAIGGSGDRAAAVRENLRMLDAGSSDFLLFLNRKMAVAQVVAQRLATLGEQDTAITLLEGYYFGRGQWARLAPEAGDEDRSTFSLFEPPMSGLWRHPRFENLLKEVGLEDHWRRTGRTPDFRTA